MNGPDVENDVADEKITRFYRDGERSDGEENTETANAAEEQTDGDSEKKADGEGNANNKKPARKRGIERHLYPCPHCGELILDHFTECPKCGGKVQPRGYHVDEEKRKKIMRVFRIVGIMLSIGAVALFIALANK